MSSADAQRVADASRGAFWARRWRARAATSAGRCPCAIAAPLRPSNAVVGRGAADGGTRSGRRRAASVRPPRPCPADGGTRSGRRRAASVRPPRPSPADGGTRSGQGKIASVRPPRPSPASPAGRHMDGSDRTMGPVHQREKRLTTRYRTSVSPSGWLRRPARSSVHRRLGPGSFVHVVRSYRSGNVHMPSP